MVHGRKRKRRFAGSHQRSWIWGRHVVAETLSAGRWPIRDLFLAETLDEVVVERARSDASGAAVRVVSADELALKCGSSDHQGYAARMGPFPYCDWRDLLQRTSETAFLAILDGVQDPHNMGAILRSAEAFGVDGVLLRETGSCEINGHVARSSAGAVNHLRVARFDDPQPLVAELQRRDIRTVVASEKSSQAIHDCDLHGSVAVVIGGEGDGVSPDMLQRANVVAAIPLHGRTASLNAAVAAGVCFYEVRRQDGAGAHRHTGGSDEN